MQLVCLESKRTPFKTKTLNLSHLSKAHLKLITWSQEILFSQINLSQGYQEGYFITEDHIFLHKNIEGTLFCDAASGFIFAKSQSILTAMETIESRILFERQALSAGIQIKSYCTDNGIYTSRDFLKELSAQKQGIRLSGVGGHYQNGIAEIAIKQIVRSARTRSSPVSKARSRVAISRLCRR